MNTLDTAINTADKAMTVTTTYGIGNVISTVVVILVVIYFIIQMFGTQKQWKTDSSTLVQLRSGIDVLIREMNKTRIEHGTTMALLDQISQRYNESLTPDQCIKIAVEVLTGTKTALELKAIKTILANDIANKWERIEIKIREFVSSQWKEDITVLSEFKILDGQKISDLIDPKDVQPLTDFMLIAIRGKYSDSDVSDGLTNIYRDLISKLTTNIKNDSIQP